MTVNDTIVPAALAGKGTATHRHILLIPEHPSCKGLGRPGDTLGSIHTAEIMQCHITLNRH